MATQLQPMGEPLSSIEMEGDFIGSLLSANELIEAAADIVSPADFHEAVHARIYEAILFERAKGQNVSPIMLKPHFENDEALKQLGGLPYIARLTGLATVINSLDNARHIADLSARRGMRDALREAMACCGDPKISTAEIASMADSAVSERATESLRMPSAAQCMGELLDAFDDHRPGVSCYSIPSLDALLGPVEPSDLVIMAGRPGMGKTAVALSYALGAAMGGHGTMFVSLEMSARQLAARMAADMCYGPNPVAFERIRDGRLSVGEKKRIAEAVSELSRHPLRIVDTGRLTTGRLGRAIRSTQRQFAAQGKKLELVIIDYLQLLSPDHRRNSQYETISQISMDCKALAKDHDVGIIALAQLSREVEKRGDKRPQLSDLRDSGQIEQDADAVLFLLREEYYLRKAEPDRNHTDRLQWEQAMDAARGRIEFILAKKRNGVEGVAHGQFHGAFQAVRG